MIKSKISIVAQKPLLRFVAVLLAVLLTALSPFVLAAAYASVLPQTYGATYYAALKIKYDRLTEVQGEKIVVIGGSSVAFGIDSKIAEQELGVPVVNFGLYAAFGLKCMLELSLDALGPGDIVVIAPELSSQMYSDFVGSEYLLQACEGREELLWKLGPSYFKGLISKLPAHLQAKRELAEKGATESAGVYALSSFDSFGDIIYDRPENIMDGMMSEANLPEISGSLVSDEFVDMLNTYTADARLRGAQVFFSFCPVNEKAVELADNIDIPGFLEELNGRLHCRVIASLEDHIMDAGYFYDSNFHMNNAGAVYNTLLLVNDLKRIQEDTRPNVTQIPKPPLGAGAADVLRSGEQGGLLYDITANGAVITGLSEEGLIKDELTVPEQIDNVAVYKIASGAFRNAAATTLTLPETVRVLGARLFEDSRVTRVYLNAADLPEVGDGLTDDADPAITICVPASLFGEYITDYFWSRYSACLASQN